MIRLGTAGAFGYSYEEAFALLKENGLGALEVEFTYGVRMTDAQAKEIGRLAGEYGIHLSVHAPYYINLAAKEPEKAIASKKRIMQSCERAHQMGATHVVFHAGFYQAREPEAIYRTIKTEIISLLEAVEQSGFNVKLAPETTGKATQFGDIDELLRLSRETGCSMCVDFSHIYARNIGKIDYDSIMLKLKGVGHVHAHFSGIEFSDKGERRHEKTTPEFARPLLEALKRHDIDITVINESPYMFEDALMCGRILESLP